MSPFTDRRAYEWRKLKRLPSWRARLRFLYWRWARRYETELCLRCGGPYYKQIGDTWWHAPDGLWRYVEGGTGGLRCPRCFTADCRARGILVYWAPVIDNENYFKAEGPVAADPSNAEDPTPIKEKEACDVWPP